MFFQGTTLLDHIVRFQTPRAQQCFRHNSMLSFQAVIAFDFNTVMIVKYLGRSSFAK